MQYFLVISMSLLFSLTAFAKCKAGYTDDIYICNYNKEVKVSKLLLYSEWQEIEFNNLNVTSKKDKYKDVTFLKSISFKVVKHKPMPQTKNYKINYVCNDANSFKAPSEFVKIKAADNVFCKQYPSNSLIYLDYDSE